MAAGLQQGDASMIKGAGGGGGRLMGRLGLLLLLPILAGCGNGKGTVSGKVIFKDKGLPGGRITFRPADPKKNSVTVPIDPDGNYEVQLPVGEVLVSIDNSELQDRPARPVPVSALPKINLPRRGKPDAAPAEPPPTAPEKLPGKYERIPAQYADADRSGLTFTVEGGAQTKNFELK
jgi:hypothetical protein